MFKTKNVIQKHEEISKNAFSLFTDTVKMLEIAEEEISKDINLTAEKILKAESELKSLGSIQKKNSMFKKKINEFLNKLNE